MTMPQLQERPLADGRATRAIRALVRRAIDAYAEAHPLAFPGSLRASVPRLTVFPWAEGEHALTLYGATWFWPPHVHYVGPHGHVAVPLGRTVELFAWRIDEDPQAIAGWYAKHLSLSAQRPHLTARQVERLWHIVEREKVTELTVMEECRRRFAKDIALLTRAEYDQLVRWVEHEGHRQRMVTEPRYAAKIEDAVRTLRERF